VILLLAMAAWAFGAGTGTASSIVPLADTTAPANYSMDGEPAYTNGTSNTVSWSAGDDPGGSTPIEYEVQVSRSLGFGTIEAASSWVTGTNYTFIGLEDAILYYFRVRARDAVGNVGGFSAPTSSTQDASPPSVPLMGAEPAYTVGTSNTLVWGASVDVGVGGVQYFAEASSSSTFATAAATTGWIASNSPTVGGLASGVTYYFHVKSRDGFGRESGWSSVVFSTQDADPPTVAVLNPEPPFTVGTFNVVAWSASLDSGVGGVEYQFEFSTSSTFAFGVVTTPWQASTTYNATPLAGATLYYFRVKARDAFAQETLFSSILSSTQDDAPPAVPAVAAEPAFTAGTSNGLVWAASTDAGSGGVQYLAQQSRASNFGVVEEASEWISSTSFTFTKLDDGATYYYRVKARDAVGLESAFSGVEFSTQDHSPPDIPLVAVEPPYTAGTSNAVAWAASADAGVGGVEYYTQASSSPTFSPVDATSGWSSFTFAFFAGLTDGVTYHYRVKARDAFGHESAFSVAVSSTQDNAAPRDPVLDPEPPYTAGLSNTVTWGPSTDAGAGGVQYFLQFSDSATFSSGVVTVGPQAGLSYTATALTDGTAFYYRVIAFDALGWFSAWSAAVSSTQDNSAPSVPTISGPGTFTPGTQFALSWTPSSDATSGGVEYFAEQSRDAAFSVMEDQSGWIPFTGFTFTKLDDAALYYYRVKARDAVLLESVFSRAESSTQDASPPSVPLLYGEPAFTSGTANGFAWAPSSDAGVGGIEYLAELSASPVFATVDAAAGWGPSTSANFSGLADDITYYLRVRARDAFLFESSNSGRVWSTQDNAAPSQPSPFPEPPFTPGSANSVSWSAATDAGVGGVVYDLQVDTNPAFSSASTWADLTTTSFTAGALADGTTYHFRVRARDAFGFATPYSGSVGSQQDASAPGAAQVNPEPAFTAGTSNTVSWTASTDAGVGGVEYLVQASRSALFSPLEDESGWVASTSFTFTRLDDGETFYFHVVARDAFGFQSNVSSAVSSTQDNSAPTTPVLVSEPAYTQGTSNNITWGASFDAGVGGIEYQLRYSANPTFSSGVTTSAFQSNMTATVSGLADGTTFYFEVRARDALGWMTPWSLVVASTQDASPPSAPGLAAEPAFTAGSANQVAWSPSSDFGVGGVTYWAEFAAGPGFGVVIGNSGWTPATSASFVGLSDGVTYYFRVKSRDSFNQESAFSGAAHSQQDASAPSVPGASPLSAFTSGAAVAFSWNASFDAGVGGIEYEAQYAAGAGFSPVLGSSGWTGAISFAFGGLADGVTYALRVRARDAFGYASSFSSTVTTTMDASPPAVPLLVPPPPFTAGGARTIEWAASADAGVGGVEYQSQYASSPTFASASTVTSSWGVTSPYTVLGLLDGVTYYHRARARDSFQYASAWSSPEHSTQDASAPSVPILEPLAFFIDGPSTELAWSAAVDAGVGGVEYQAEASSDPQFNSVAQTGPWTGATTFVFAGLNDATVYYYHARARDAFGYTSAWSASQVAMNDFLPPPVPTVTTLSPFSKGLSATLFWRPVVDAGIGAEQYQALAFATTDTTAPFAASAWLEGTTALMGGLPEGQRVYFAVRSRDGLGHESALSTLVSTVADNSPPPTPSLAALPAYTNGLNLSLVWSPVMDAGVGGVLYRVQVSLDPSFQVGVLDSGWLNASPHLAPNLLDGRTYFARLRAQDAFSIESAWSAVERTQMDLAPPTIPAVDPLPEFTAGDAVDLVWSPAFDAGIGGVEYLAQASLATDFAVIARESVWQSQARWHGVGLADGSRYYFRVLSRDAFFHASAPSGPVFTTLDASPPSTPELLVMPAFTAGLQQTVRWTPSVDVGVGGVEFQVETSTNASFGQGAFGSGWISALQYTFAGLADGTGYYFRVKARDAFGFVSNWSALRTATPDDSRPTIHVVDTTILSDSPDVALSGTAADATSGIADVLFSTTGGAVWTTASGREVWTAALAGLAEGRTEVWVKARDLVGQESPVVAVEVIVDQTAPLVAFQSPTNGSVLTGLVGVYAVVVDPNLASLRLQQRAVGRANFTDLVANATVARGDNFLGLWDTRALSNGLYELRATARDALDRTTARTIQVRLLNSDLAVSYTDLQVSDATPATGDRINVSAVVTNFGTAPAENVSIRVTDNGVLIFERSGIAIGPHAAFVTLVPLVVSRAGPHTFQLEWSYPAGALDTGSQTTLVIEAHDPPVPKPPPFLVEYASTLGPLLLAALVVLGAIAGWATVQVVRMRRAGAGTSATPLAAQNVAVEWESDELF
jgi:hypothetical protein